MQIKKENANKKGKCKKDKCLKQKRTQKSTYKQNSKTQL